MQYKVPQDVQREDRLVGPLTLRQLIICGIGFTIAYALYTSISRDYELITALIPVIILGLITVTFAFIKPHNLVFEKFILFWIESLILPRQRYWLKGMADPSRLLYPPRDEEKTKKVEIVKTDKKPKTINELTEILDKKYK